MKIAKSLLLAFACTGLTAASTVNIQISQALNQATNFANRDGSVSNGLVWGLMVSTADNNFSPLWQGFQLSTSLNGTLIEGTDDYFLMSPVLTAQGTITDIANPGKINIMNGININVPENTITTGVQFAIVWFDPAAISGSNTLIPAGWYGLLTNPAWTIPAPGVTQNISSFFASNPDPQKRADDFQVQPVPEPSAALCGLLGAIGLLRRRR